jgi:lipoate-protein ligase A
MHLLDLTLPTPAENLALDEALLEEAEAGGQPGEILRLWESAQPLVVVGRSSRVAEEVNLEACRAAGIPVLRRCSGGAAVVAGPGCLMYAVVLSYAKHPELHVLETAHRFVLGNLKHALEGLRPHVEMLGTSDLTLNDRKFSGNSLRCKRDFLLYHGTVLYQFDLSWISQYLGHAPRQPAYRRERPHDQFVANFPAPAAQLRAAIRRVWSAGPTLHQWPRELTRRLVHERYALDAWNLRL